MAFRPNKEEMKQRMNQAITDCRNSLTRYSQEQRSSVPGKVQDCSSFVEWIIFGGHPYGWYTATMDGYNGNSQLLKQAGYKKIGTSINQVPYLKFGDVLVHNRGSGSGNFGHAAIIYTEGDHNTAQIIEAAGSARPPGSLNGVGRSADKPWTSIWRIAHSGVALIKWTQN